MIFLSSQSSLNPAPLTNLGNPGQTTFIGDIDGDGRDEIICQNGSTLTVLAYLVYGDISKEPAWTADEKQQLVTAWASFGPIAGVGGAGVAPAWTLAANDVRGAFDLDGDNKAEVLVFSGQQIGVLGWVEESLQVRWQASGSIPGGGPHGWVLDASNQFFAADLDGDGKDELIVLSAGGWVGVIEWDGSQLTCLWLIQSDIPGGWTINPTDQFYAADLDGDGSDELLVLNPMDGWVGVIKWDGTQLNCQWKTNGPISATGANNADWTYASSAPSQNCNVIAAKLSANEPDSVLVGYYYEISASASRALVVLCWDGQELRASYNQAAITTTIPYEPWNPNAVTTSYVVGDWNLDGADEVLQFSVASWLIQQTFFSWNGTYFIPLWQVAGSVPNSGGSSPEWQMNPSDQYFAADVDGDGGVEFIIASPQSAGHTTSLLRVVTGSGPEIYYSAQTVQPWGVDLIAQGPITPLTPFTSGQQPQVYEYISDQVDPDCNGDIRKDYTNLNDQDKIGGFSSRLATITNPGTYDSLDWDFVYYTLKVEFEAVPVVVSLFNNRADLFSQLSAQQSLDLNYVIDQLNASVQPNADAKGLLIFIAILDAVLWGAAAVPGLGWFAIPIAMAASAVGSLTTFFPSSTEPQPVDTATCWNEISSQYSNVTVMNAKMADAVLRDEIKLQMIGDLAGGPWSWDPSTTPDLVKASVNPNRLSFYQILAPTYFSVLVWPPVWESVPGAMYNCYQGQGEWKELNDLPSNVWLMQATSNGNVFWVLAQGTSSLSDLVYPGPDMMNELASLGVPLSDVLYGNEGWSMPYINLTKGDVDCPP